MGTGGGNVPIVKESPQIIVHNLNQKTYIRKYPVDKENLKKILREAKVDSDITNECIAKSLNVSISTVEHWFRKDESFSIPSPEIWLELKKILKINTDEFDKSIMTFMEKTNLYDKSNRVYDEKGIAPTLTQQEEKILTRVIKTEPKSINETDMPESPKIITIGNYSPSNHDASRIVDETGIAPTVKENHGTVTAVVQSVKNEDLITMSNKNAKHQQDLLQSKDDICRTIPAGTHGSTPHLLKTVINEQPLRIRKLTPKECWRLMRIYRRRYRKMYFNWNIKFTII